MSTAATLRQMIAEHETRLSALREALEMIEAVDAQMGEGVGTSHPPVATAPTAGLYGEDGRTVKPRLSRAQAAVLDAIRRFGPHASVADIAKFAGIADDSVSPMVQALKRAGLIDTVGRAHAREFVLLDGSEFWPAPEVAKVPPQPEPKSEPKRQPAPAPADNRTVPTKLIEFFEREHPAGCRLSNAEIARAMGETEKRVADGLMGLKRSKRATVTNDARGRVIHLVRATPAPTPRPAVGPTVTRDPEPPKPKPAARPPIPYVPTKLDHDRRAEEQAQIEEFLARQGARKFESGLLVSLLEQAFAAEDIAFEQVHSVKENKGGRTPYRVAGKLVSSDAAIKHADVIRRRMGLPLIAAEAGEVAA